MGTFATDITDFAAGFSLFELAIRATIALATAALVCLLLRRRSAAIRHRIWLLGCLLYTSPSPRDLSTSRMPSSA